MYVVEDVTCLACGCLCDDVRVEIADGRVVAAGGACPIGRDWFAAPHPGEGLPLATIDGRPASFEEAIARAAEILGAARSPLVWGLTGTTVEANREALAIADAIGATVDLGGSRAGEYRLAAFQRVGQVSATLGEVRDRADLVVFWRTDPVSTHPRLWDRCVEPPGEFVPGGRAGRAVVVVDSAPTATSARADLTVGVGPDRSGDLLRVLRGLVRGKALDPSRVERATGVPFPAIRDLADRMLGARYGAIFAGGEVADAGEAEALATLVRDLNDGRRFVLMDPGSPGNPAGAGSVATWQAGAPTSIDFARGHPRFLPGEATLAGRPGQVDALLAVADAAMLATAAPHLPLAGVPTVRVGPGATRPDDPSSVAFDVARPGIEAAGTVGRFDGVMLPLRPLLAPGPRPTDRAVLKALGDRLRGQGGLGASGRASGSPQEGIGVMSPCLEIPQDVHDAMVAHCVREAPLECCGLLGGVAPAVSSFHPMRNASASETRYDADPRDLIAAVQSLRDRGAEILAIYHSHPRWAAVPSKTDLRENHYGEVPRIIISLLGEAPEVRAWRLDPDSYEELPWRIVGPGADSPSAATRLPP